MRLFFILALISATLPAPGLLFRHVHLKCDGADSIAHALRPHVHGHSHSHGHEHPQPLASGEEGDADPLGEHDDNAVYLSTAEMLPLTRGNGLEDVLSASQIWLAELAPASDFRCCQLDGILPSHGPPRVGSYSKVAERRLVLRC